MSNTSTSSKHAVILFGSFLVLAAAQLIYLMFTPNDETGHDYWYFIPRLIEGYLFFKVQGLHTPWYTPLFCGGLPAYGNPQSLFYSVPQFLTFIFNPWIAIQISCCLFLILGGLSMYKIATVLFDDWRIAIIAGLSFATNGFYRSRMIVGHLTYQSFMLIPLLGICLIDRRMNRTLSIILLSVVGAYFVYSGSYFVSFMAIPSLIFIVAVAKLTGNNSSITNNYELCCRVIGGLAGSLCLASSKLVAVYSFLSHNPRSISVSQADGVASTILLVSSQLFSFISYMPLGFGPWEYDASLSPLLVIGLIPLINLKKINRGDGRTWPKITIVFVSALLLAIIGGLGGQSNLLHNTPILLNIGVNFRFSGSFIVLIILLSSLGFSRLKSTAHKDLALLGITLTCFLTALPWHVNRANPPDVPVYPISNALRMYRFAEQLMPRDLKVVKVGVADSATISLPSLGMSIDCYDPIFASGYPNFQITPGRVDEIHNGHFNLSNPACYAYPTENHCRSGDAINVSDRANMEKFISFETPNWPISPLQHAANILSGLGLIIIGILTLRVLILRYLLG